MSATPYRAAIKRFAVVGHPIGHSLSPVMMRAAFDALGLACSYDAIDVVDAAGMARAVTALRAGERDGLNVTVPHKRAALALADLAGPEATRSGAANVLVREASGRIRAENTDAPAIVRVIEPLLPAMVLNTTLEAEVMDVSPLQLSNAKTLLVDPRDGTLVIVQKKRGPSACEVGQFSANSFATPNCSVPVSGLDNPSGGDVSPDGTYVAVRNESLAFVWVRPPGSALVDAFRGQRCAFPTLATPADGECNGEALGFSADGSSLTSASETGPCPMANAHGYTFQP